MPRTSVLVTATEDDFAWLLGGTGTRQDLQLPDGGVDHPDVLRAVRAMARQVRARHDQGTWLIVSDGEVVGLCSYKNAPDQNGAVEIGFGVAASRRRQGHATRAVAALLGVARSDSAVRALVAETSATNLASQRALAKNGFARSGNRTDKEDGDLLLWRADL